MNDDWRNETQLALNNSYIFKALKSKCEKDSAGQQIMALVDDAVYYAYQRTKTVIRHMGEFTLHDGDHLFRVLNHMERLATEENINEFSVPELMLLILTSFFHDIGMAPDEKEVLAWKKVWDAVPIFADTEEEDYFKQFQRFCSGYPDRLSEIDNKISLADNSNADILKAYLITDYIRGTHADRAIDIIQKDWEGRIVYRDYDLTSDFAQICTSHNGDAQNILNLDSNCNCGTGIYACLPMIAILLRLADLLDFDGKRTPTMLFSHLSVRHPVSIAEWNKHRSIQAWEISPNMIQFSAKCKHPAIESSIHDFCNLIDNELSACNNLAHSLNNTNKLNNRKIVLAIPYKVNRDKIETKKNLHGKPYYFYKETRFNLSKKQVIDLLMGTKLYGDPEIALRELLQNSIDACELRQALEIKWGNNYTPEIIVKYYSENGDDILEIIDNGTGMDQYIIDNYYSRVGSSFYKSTDFYDLRAESNAKFTPRSRFGIGILSCFMVADTLTVDTRRVYKPHASSEPLNITVEGQESIFWIKQGQRQTPGTSTKLILRRVVNPWEKMLEDEFVKSVENVVPNPPFKISIETTSKKKTRDENSFKELKAISLKDYTWKEHENIRTFEFDIEDKKLGIVGSAIVAILEEKGIPVENISITSKEIQIDGSNYSLAKKLMMSDNKIVRESSSITITDTGEIKEDNSTGYLVTSKSRISLHGIEIPTTLFPDYWNQKQNAVKITWPFPLILLIDVCGDRDLDLNSSRNQILTNEKWVSLEEDLAFLICKNLASSTNNSYWQVLKDIFNKTSTNKNFLIGLNRA